MKWIHVNNFRDWFFCKLPATSCSFLRSTVGKSRRKAWPNNVTRKSSTRSKKRQNAKWPEIRFLSRLDLIVARNKVFPAFLFQKHVVCGSTRNHTEACQMDDVLREDIGRSYSIDSHWFPLAQISCSSAPTPHRQHRPPADFYLGFGKTSRQLGGWAADSGECDSSLQGRPTLGQGGDGQCLNQRWPAMLRLLTRRFAHKPSAWLRPVTVSHNWMVDLGSFVFIQIKLM